MLFHHELSFYTVSTSRVSPVMMFNSFYSTEAQDCLEATCDCLPVTVTILSALMFKGCVLCECVRVSVRARAPPSFGRAPLLHRRPCTSVASAPPVCCLSPGAQKHPQTLTSCNLHRGNKTTGRNTHFSHKRFARCRFYRGVSKQRVRNLQPARLKMLELLFMFMNVLHDLQVSSSPNWPRFLVLSFFLNQKSKSSFTSAQRTHI